MEPKPFKKLGVYPKNPRVGKLKRKTMKKTVLTGALALLGIFANAQQFGAKAGMNISSLSEDGFKSKVGAFVGVFMNHSLSDKFSIQPELLYSMKGAKYEEQGVSGSWNVDYISVPVMLQYNVTPALYLEAGPEVSLLLSAKSKISAEGESMSVDVKDMSKSLDFGAAFGAGYSFTPQIGASVRYVAGFSDIIKDNPGDAVKNGVFQLGLSYRFSK